MCGGTNAYAAYQNAANTHATPAFKMSSQRIISDIVQREAGVYIDPTVIRLIIKYNWSAISKAAHEIHGS